MNIFQQVEVCLRGGWTVQQNKILTFEGGVLERHKAAKDTARQLNYFRKRLGSYSLIYITPDLLLKES